MPYSRQKPNLPGYLTGNYGEPETDAFDILNAPGLTSGSPNPLLAQLAALLGNNDASSGNMSAGQPEFLQGADKLEHAGGRPLVPKPTPLRGKTEGPIHGPVAPVIEPEPVDPNLTAINALMELASNAPQPGAGGIDIAAIMKEAAGAAKAPFKAQIRSTRNQNERAKADTDYSSKQIRKMYRALARGNRKSAVRESEQSQQAAQAIQGLGQESATELAAQNQARLDAQAAQNAALGSPELAATLNAQINANTSEGARQVAESGMNAGTLMSQRGEAERHYLNRSANNARLIGTNRAADLYGDLQDYLQGNRDKIGELRGQAAAAAGQARQAAAASAASAQSDAYNQQYAAHQDLLKNQMALLGMKTDLQQQDFDNNMSQEELALRLRAMTQQDQEEQLVPGFDNRLIEALPDEQRSALMLQQFLNPEAGASLGSIMQNPAVRSGFYTNEEGDKIPLGGNPLNSQQLLAELGMTNSDPQQNFILSQIIAQLASANTDLPYGAQR